MPSRRCVDGIVKLWRAGEPMIFLGSLNPVDQVGAAPTKVPSDLVGRTEETHRALLVDGLNG
jgi:hypothetical protein